MTTVEAHGLEVGRLMGDIYKEDSERDYDEDEEGEDGDGEEEGRGRQMLGFMFGNVDDTGGLDEEYLDQVATQNFTIYYGIISVICIVFLRQAFCSKF